MCTLPTPSPSPPPTTMSGQARPATQCRFHARGRMASSQERCTDHKNLIRVSPQSLTKDPRRRTLAICILQSAVRPHLNATPRAYCLLSVFKNKILDKNLRNIIHISLWILKILRICIRKYTDPQTATSQPAI